MSKIAEDSNTKEVIKEIEYNININQLIKEFSKINNNDKTSGKEKEKEEDITTTNFTNQKSEFGLLKEEANKIQKSNENENEQNNTHTELNDNNNKISCNKEDSLKNLILIKIINYKYFIIIIFFINLLRIFECLGTNIFSLLSCFMFLYISFIIIIKFTKTKIFNDKNKKFSQTNKYLKLMKIFVFFGLIFSFLDIILMIYDRNDLKKLFVMENYWIKRFAMFVWVVTIERFIFGFFLFIKTIKLEKLTRISK